MLNPVSDNSNSVVVVEDERDVRDLIVLHLKREGYRVHAFESAELAQDALKNGERPNLFVLDWMLPGQSGLDFAKSLRKQFGQSVGILLLTARADTLDKVLGLEVGADDYLTKPFEVREFLARIRALLRRMQSPELSAPAAQQKSKVHSVGPFRLDEDAKRISLRDQDLQLTPHEYKLLSSLIAQPNKAFERDELIRMIQGKDVKVVDRTIDTTVLGLRKKLGADAEWVETVRGFGYRLKSE